MIYRSEVGRVLVDDASGLFQTRQLGSGTCLWFGGIHA